MAEPSRPNVSQEIDKSAKTVSVGALQKKGLKQVKVLRPSDIQEMITKAVDKAIASESRNIAESERQKYIEASRDELKKMMQQWGDSQKRQQELELDKEGLQKRTEELHRTIDLQKEEIERLQKAAKESNPADVTAAVQKVEQEKLQLEGQLKVLNTALEQVTESNRKLKEDLEEAAKTAGQAAASASEPQQPSQIETLLVTMMQQMQEQKQKSDVAEIGEHIGKMADKLTDAISSKMAAGGGGGGGAAADVGPEFKEVVLDKLFSRDAKGADVESNIGSVGAKEKKAGGVGGALAKLKSMQKGGQG